MHISQGKFEFDREEVVQFEYTFVGKKKKRKTLSDCFINLAFHPNLEFMFTQRVALRFGKMVWPRPGVADREQDSADMVE